MARKALNEEKEVKNKKSSKKVVDDKKTSKPKAKDVKKESAKKVESSKKKTETKKVAEAIVEVQNQEEVIETVTVNNENNKKRKIFNVVITVLAIGLIIGAFIISVIETNEKNKYYKTITFNEVSEIMNSEETKIIYWASPSCDYCKMFSPIIKEVSYEYELTFNYLNTSSLDGDQYATMYTHFAEYDEKYNSSNLGTPSLILVKDGKIVNISVGYLQEEELVDYLKTNGLIVE